jgi:hypothetical protein
MSTPMLALWIETGALRGDLRGCGNSPRPIPCPQTSPVSRFGGAR